MISFSWRFLGSGYFGSFKVIENAVFRLSSIEKAELGGREHLSVDLMKKTVQSHTSVDHKICFSSTLLCKPWDFGMVLDESYGHVPGLTSFAGKFSVRGWR